MRPKRCFNATRDPRTEHSCVIYQLENRRRREKNCVNPPAAPAVSVSPCPAASWRCSMGPLLATPVLGVSPLWVEEKVVDGPGLALPLVGEASREEDMRP